MQIGRAIDWTNRVNKTAKPESQAAPRSTAASPEKSFGEILNNFAASWEKAQRESEAKIKKMPSDYRPLLELQMTVHRLNLSSELVSRAGEAASSTVKKLQQMGTN